MPLFPLDQSSSNWPEWAVRVQTQTHTQTHRPGEKNTMQLCPRVVSDQSPSVVWHVQHVRLISPFLTGRMFVRRTYFGQFDEL